MISSWRALGPRGQNPDARISWDLVARVWRLLRPHRRYAVGLTVAVAVTAGLGAIPPLLYRAIIDRAIVEQRTGLLSGLAGGLILVAVASAASQVATRWCAAHLGEVTIFDLRAALFARVQAMPFAFFTQTRTGALLNRLTSDLAGGHRAFTSTAASVLETLLGVAVTVGAMLLLDVRLTVLALGIAPLFVVVTRRLRGRLHGLLADKHDAEAALSNQLEERFQVGGALLVKLFGRSETEQAAFSRRAGRVRDLGIRTAVASRVFHGGFALVAAVGTGIIYWVGGRLVISEQVSLGTIVAFSAYLTQLYTPLTMLANARVDVATALVSFQRAFEVLDLPAARADDDRTGGRRSRSCRGEVVFDRVWFRYPTAVEVTPASLRGGDGSDGQPDDDGQTADGEPAPGWALRGVSFVIAPGDTLALVGPSGAGKTTVALLLARLYEPTAGVVRVGGQDIRELTAPALRMRVGMVTQDPHLFHDTVANNLLYARPQASMAELVTAARAARIHELIASLPDGYDTVVGERGYRFSGGEKQRLTIARLLLQDPAVVILDEATAHLDSESERLVQTALDEALEGRTSLVIAHRLSTVEQADHLLVMDRGRIVERGSHHGLLAAGGLYARMHRLQRVQPEQQRLRLGPEVGAAGRRAGSVAPVGSSPRDVHEV